MLRLVILLVFASIASACDCSGNLRGASGEIWVAAEDHGEVGGGETLRLNLGKVTSGDIRSLSLAVQNRGRAALTVREVEALSGDVVVGDAGAPFSIDLDPGAVIQTGETLSVPVRFAPLTEAGSGDADVSASVRIWVDGALEGADWVQLELHGTALDEDCSVPVELDFGHVWTGERFTLPFTLSNTATGSRTIEVGEITGADGSVFVMVEGTAGPVTLGEGESLGLAVEFAPTEVRHHSAQLRLRRGERCSARNVTLKGWGIDAAVVGIPDPVDCGHVPVGTAREVAVSLFNLSHHPVDVSELAMTGAEFEWGSSTGELSLPAQSGHPLVVRCTPTRLGEAIGRISFKTSSPRQPSGQVALKLWGGAPDIRVEPRVLEFGDVAFVEGASPPVTQRRTLTVQNVGDAARDLSGNLRLGTAQSDGAYGAPYVSVVPLNETTSSAEFSISIEPSYRDADGLSAPPGRNSVQLFVTLNPLSPGPKEAELRVLSNDPDEPEAVVLVKANALVLPDCRYSTSLSTLDFGMVAHPGEKSLHVTVVNEGVAPDEVCILSMPRISRADERAFELVDAPNSVRLAPGDQYALEVLFRPGDRTAWRYEGALEFTMSSKAHSRGTVGLMGRTGAQCLTLIPQALEFGEVQVGCSSAVAKVRAFNGCTRDIELLAYVVVDSSSTPAGDPSCSGPGPCDSFRFVSGPDLATGPLLLAAGGDPVELELEFRAGREGNHFGTAQFTTVEQSGSVTYTLGMSGAAVQSAAREDVFRQHPAPQLDIAITYHSVDHFRVPEADPWPRFEQAIADLVNDLRQKGIDFHIAANEMMIKWPVNWTEPGWSGEFIEPLGGGGAVVTATTPDPVQAVIDRTHIRRVGLPHVGNCFETIFSALTPPRIDGPNAGFLRADAGLLALCWGPGPDASSEPNILPVIKWYNWLVSIKGKDRPGAVTVVGLSGIMELNPVDPCHWGTFVPETKTRYLQMAALTDGAWANRCKPGWYGDIAEAVGTAAGIRSAFPITGSPDPASIEVLVDGSIVAAVNASGDNVWTYDPQDKRVRFASGQVPGHGAEVRIRYNQVCH